MFSGKNVVSARTRASRVLVAASLTLSMLLPAAKVLAAGDPELSWIRQFGTNTSSNETARAVDDDGNTFVGGTTDGALSGQTNAGGTDGWIKKYDRFGNVLFTEQFGTSGDDVVTGIAIEQTGIHVIGYTSGTFSGQTSAGGVDIFVRKYDPALDALHTTMLQFGTDGDDYALSADSDQSGSFMAGKTSGAFPGVTNAGGFDAFAARLGSDLNIRWIDQFGSEGNDWATGVDFADGSEVAVSGTTDGTLPDQENAGGTDALMRRINVTTGNPIETIQFGTPQNDEGNGVVNSRNEDAIVAGTTEGSMPGFTSLGGKDAFVRAFSLNPPGVNPEWTQQFGTDGDDEVSGAAFAGERLMYVIGTTSGTFPGQTNAGGKDVFMRKYYTYDGQFRWQTQFGSAFDDTARAVALDQTLHHIFAIGETSGALSGQTNSGGDDAFIVKYKQDNDADGIYNEVDTLPDDFTNDFSDFTLDAGSTVGTVVDRADQNLVIQADEGPDAGVTLEAKSGGPTSAPAEVSMCQGLAESQLDPGDAINVLCGSAHIGVTKGLVDTTFVAPDGMTTTTSFDTGNKLVFDGTSAFTAAETNPDSITVHIGSTPEVIAPGRTIKLMTLTKDTFLRQGTENLNEGANPMLVVRKKGDIRSLVGFDLAGQNMAGLTKATLVLKIGSMPPSHWKNGGSPIEAVRLTSDWTEGNGKDLDVPDADATRGTDAGATWKCATDTNITNTKKDCSSTWDGGDNAVAARTAPTVTITNGMTGEVTFDVTQDVLAGATNGWLIDKVNESHAGNIKFYSKEGASGDASLAPKLILEFQN